jgi:hypothetical protein
MSPTDERRGPEPGSEPGAGVTPEELETERERAPAPADPAPPAPQGAAAGATGSETPTRAAGNGAEPAGAPGRRRFGDGQTGFYFYGVVRTRGWRGREREDVLRIRYRDLEALVRPGPFKLPALDGPHLQAHQRTVESIMRHATVLPAPFGVVFRGRRALVRFLEDQYLTLDEGLAFLEGNWEVRVHVASQDREVPTPDMEDAAVHVYAELRRSARAAIPFAREDRRLFSAAFLVERGVWIDFVNHADDLAAVHPALSIDVTGPWPPYDFVRMSV